MMSRAATTNTPQAAFPEALTIADTAKALRLKLKDLNRHMRANHWSHKFSGEPHEAAYRARLENGDLEHRITTVAKSDGEEATYPQVFITPRGLAKLEKVFSASSVDA